MNRKSVGKILRRSYRYLSPGGDDGCWQGGRLMLRGRWYYFLLHISVHELVNELTDRLLENP